MQENSTIAGYKEAQFKALRGKPVSEGDFVTQFSHMDNVTTVSARITQF